MKRRVTFHCAHCQVVAATATGEWDDGALGDDELLILCRECHWCVTELGSQLPAHIIDTATSDCAGSGPSGGD